MEYLEINLEYNQLFCPAGSRFCGSSQMGLDEGARHIQAQASALEEIAKNMPQKEKFVVGLKNCETRVVYKTEVNNVQDTLKNAREILDYISALPEQYQPRRLHIFPPRKHKKELGAWLNTLGKTMALSGLVRLGLLLFGDARYGWVKDSEKK